MVRSRGFSIKVLLYICGSIKPFTLSKLQNAVETPLVICLGQTSFAYIKCSKIEYMENAVSKRDKFLIVYLAWSVHALLDLNTMNAKLQEYFSIAKSPV